LIHKTQSARSALSLQRQSCGGFVTDEGAIKEKPARRVSAWPVGLDLLLSWNKAD